MISQKDLLLSVIMVLVWGSFGLQIFINRMRSKQLEALRQMLLALHARILILEGASVSEVEKVLLVLKGGKDAVTRRSR